MGTFFETQCSALPSSNTPCLEFQTAIFQTFMEHISVFWDTLQQSWPITQVWERNRPDEFLQFCITFVEMHLVSSSHYLCSVLSIYVCLSAILLPHLNADCLSSCDGTAVLQLRKLPPDPPHCQATGRNGKNGYYMPNAKAVTLFVRRSWIVAHNDF